MNVFPHLFRPARGGAAAVVVTFAILLTLADHAGWMGIPLAFILLSWLFKYAYILFDHAAWGIDDPPVLDIQMLNPVDEQRPLASLGILVFIYGAVKLADARLGSAVGVTLAAAAALLLPASIAVLGIDRNVLKALYPPALAHLLRGLGLMYLVVLGIIAAYILGIGLLLSRLSFLPLELALAIFGLLSIFSVLGGALYERRHELDLDTHRSPERAAQIERRAQVRRNEAIVTEAYGLVRAGSQLEAWNVLQGWLAAGGRSSADYHWLCERVSHWPDARYATRLTQEYVDRLLALKQQGQALDVVAHRLERDSGFRPGTAAVTLKMAQLAACGGGKPAVARALLSDFSQRFAGDPSVIPAEALARDLVR